MNEQTPSYAIKIKPLSVNQAWQGRRFKTKAYKAYEQELTLLLPNIVIPEGNLHFIATVGYSNKAADIDNFIKPFLDLLQKKYNFNDNRIYKLSIEKVITNKGGEFIAFNLLDAP